VREEVKAGLMIVVSLVVLSGLIIVVGGGKFFKKFDSYYINVINTAGLEIGSQVRLGGVRVGRVLEIKEPDKPGEPVAVEIGINQGTPIYRGTKALITQIGFVGDIYLLLSIQDTTGERFKIGDTIPTEESVGFAVIMSRLDGLANSLNDLISDTRQLFSQKNLEGIEKIVGNTNEAIVSVSKNLDEVADELKITTNKLRALINEVEGLVRDNRDDISDLIERAKEDLERAGDMIDTFERTAKTVDRAVNINNQNLDNLLNTMTQTIEDLRDVVQEIKNKPWSILYKEEAE
jgi:ABC-type transporter Mla subunit MlaD